MAKEPKVKETPAGMHYCRVRDENVYSCDHLTCNGGDPKEQQGMTYCRVTGSYVYSCDHYHCNN